MGLRYRLAVRVEPSIRSKPDIVFPRARVAVYVDGCFWHGCPTHFIPPKNNATWWADKIGANRERDHRVRTMLNQRGWLVLSIWEHEDMQVVATEVARAVRERKQHP